MISLRGETSKRNKKICVVICMLNKKILGGLAAKYVHWTLQFKYPTKIWYKNFCDKYESRQCSPKE